MHFSTGLKKIFFTSVFFNAFHNKKKPIHDTIHAHLHICGLAIAFIKFCWALSIAVVFIIFSGIRANINTLRQENVI